MAQFKVPILDSTSRDYAAIRDTLINAIPYFLPEWTDYNPTNPGIVLVELMAAVADGLNFNLDQIAGREPFLNLAISRRAVVNLLRLIDYDLRGPSSSVTSVVFVLAQTLAAPLLIPRGTKLRTSTSVPVTFETTEDLYIPAGNLGNEQDTVTGAYIYTADVAEGETRLEVLTPSDGTDNQTRDLPSSRAVDGTIQLYVDEGSGYVLWTRVDSLALSGPNDTHYTTDRDENDIVTIVLGDGVRGKIPPVGALMRASFREVSEDRGGVGVYGNVLANTISVIESTIYYGGSPIALSVFNPEAASGGEPHESIEEAKRLGPASIRALDRAVTQADYVYWAEKYPGVAKAGVSTTPVCSELQITVMPEGGGTPSSTLLNDLLAFLDTKKTFGTVLTVASPKYVQVALEGTVQVLSGFETEAVETRTLTAIIDFFSPDGEVEFGGVVRQSSVIATIRNQTGVDYVELTRLTRVPQASYDVWNGYSVGPPPVNNGAVFSNIIISSTTVEETWTVTFVSLSQFSVQGSVSGLQGDVGTLGATYTTENGELSFLLSSGTVAARTGDTATIKVSRLVGSITLSSDEYPILSSISGIVFSGGV